MRSCIYQGRVFHKRFKPTVHAFQYDMDYLYLDLDEIETVFNQSRFWSCAGSNLISFRRSDYLPGPLPLSDQVRDSIQRLSGQNFEGKIFLLTTPRRLGHCMNPISLFYCFDGDTLSYVLAEVHNTPWDERHVYLLEGPEFTDPTAKTFHVSPFMPMNTTYGWELGDPGRELGVAIKVAQNGDALFTASMSMKRVELSQANMAHITRRQLSQAFLTMSAIYFQAAKLWRKKVPFFRHPNKNKLQESNL